MADFLLNHTGAQINTAISSVLSANDSGGIVNADALSNFRSVIFPVGSVYIMSTNTSPESFLGGTWTLVDKEFRPQNLEPTVTLNTTNCTSATVGGHVGGHTIFMYFDITNKVALTDTAVELFTVTPSSCGVDTFYAQRMTHFTDGGNAVINSGLSGAGLWTAYDVMIRGSSTASLAAATSLSRVTITMDTTYTHMLDSFCDKFYFKRTA